MENESALSDALLRQLIAVGQVDILVGLPTLNNAATIVSVVRAVQECFTRDLSRLRTVMINSDGGSTDGTPDLIRDATFTNADMVQTSHPLRTLHRIVAPYHGLPGKLTALRTVFAAAELVQAKVVVLIDPNGPTTAAERVTELIGPVARSDVEFLTPCYRRHPRDGVLITQFVRPLVRALYGTTLDEPLDPHRGHFVDLSVEPTLRALGSQQDFAKLAARGSWFRPLPRLPELVLLARLDLAVIQPLRHTRRAQVPIVSRLFAGGTGSVRGFELDQLGPVDANGEPLGGLTRNAERTRQIKFTCPLHTEVMGVLTTAKTKITRWQDLNDAKYTLADVNGAWTVDWARQNLPKAKLEVVGSTADAVKAVAAGRAHAIVEMLDFFMAFTKAHAGTKWRVLPEKIDIGWDAIGVGKDNHELRDVLNIILYKLHSAGFVEAEWQRAFGAAMLEKVPAHPYF